MFTFAQRERIRTALEKRANRSPVRSQGKFRRLSREGRLFDKFVEKKAAEIRKLNPQASEGAILDSIIEFINSGALEKILAFITAIIGMFGVLLLALTLGLCASPAHAAEPQQSFITKAQYEANVLPWGVGTNFVKDQENRFWIIHKHMPPMRARVDGVPIFPLDEQMWNAAVLEHAKKKAKPAAVVAAKPAIKIGGDWADGFDGLISVIEQAKEAAANGDPSLLADVRASLIANRAALKPAAKQEAILTPAQARWFWAMPLPWIERNVIRALFGR